MRLSRVVVLMGLFSTCASGVYGQSLPATMPATLPAATAPATRPVVVNLSTPATALRSFLESYRAGDGAGIRKCIEFKDKKEADTFAILLEPQIAQLALARAAEAKLGRDADDRFHVHEMEKDLDEKIKLVDSLEVRVKDNTATIVTKEPAGSQPVSATGPATGPAATQAASSEPAASEPADGGDSFGPVHLEKVGAEWKIQGSDFVRKLEPAELKSIETFSAASVKLCREVMGQVNAGTIKTYAELSGKLEKGMEDIVGKALDPETGGAGTEPATGPATGPASAPASGPAAVPASAPAK